MVASNPIEGLYDHGGALNEMVCTSQYFLWWLVLLPPALAHIHTLSECRETSNGLFGCVARVTGLTPSVVRRATSLAGFWFAGQACWLTIAYLHEMGGGAFWGRSLWLALWGASALFLVVNVVILKCLMKWLPTSTSPTSSDRCLKHSRSPPCPMTLLKLDKDKEEFGGIIRKRNVEKIINS
ncbi:GPI mannosyltransferase 1 [Taenia solium]|eukprot:TsM_000689600 transcript=TsM_000689600 gene=TsM_000689600